MTRRLVVVRPQPGTDRTAALARAAGWSVDQMPLFAVAPVAWQSPDPASFDGLLLTSANAVRHAGPALATLRALPAVAVGEATATAACDLGLTVALTGNNDAAAAVAAAHASGLRHLLHLAGRDRIDQAGVTAVTVYASDPMPPPADATARLDGAVVLLHSARAARAVAALAGSRAATAVAALSPPVLAAAGAGWRATAVAVCPTDAALLVAAAMLAD